MVYQDFRDRTVADIFLVLPYVSFIATLFIMGYLALPFLALSAVLGVAAIILYRRGLLATGDVIAMPLIFSSAYALWYVIPMVALVFAIHMAWFVSKNGTKFNRQVNGVTAKRDVKWIPVKVDGQVVNDPIDDIYRKLDDGSLVDETYGVPLAGYIALGSMLGIMIYSILTALGI
ncbi:MAG: hypothetical protein JRN01_04305 [Nitrososphaerota archaeon]|nr:hypothetical protein [Nitrososphaerota archaeon]MDG6932630.1 hypothetical protein [Nitrososphaerota archaeon]